MKKAFYILLIAGLLANPVSAQVEEIVAQDVNEDDLGNVSDDFQEYFFEALTQKAIENYDKAISALQKAKEIEKLPVIFFELGKNYKALKKYDLAEENLLKAHQAKPQNQDIIEELYDVYYLTKDYSNAISAVQKLIIFDPDFTEDLANLYFLTQQYDKALTVLDDLDEKYGNSEYRDSLRRRIFAATDNKDAQIADLKEELVQNPENEQNFLHLIFMYSEKGQEEKAFEIAKKLIKEHPDSDLAHLALYKFYLNRSNISAAVESMKQVLKSKIIDTESKLKVLNDFLIYTNQNPEYEPQLEEVVRLFSGEQENAVVYEKLGEYFLEKKDKEKAIHFFEKGLEQQPENFNVLKQATLLHIEQQNFQKAQKLSAAALDYYPSQPIFYLLNGVASNELQLYEQAEESLLFGLDYLFDNPKMEADFYQQLSKAYQGLGKTDKAALFSERAQKLQK